jgi:hypothetical protein
MRTPLLAFLLFCFISLIAIQMSVADTKNLKTGSVSQENNQFYDIKIRPLNKVDSSANLQCHKKSINDATWQTITFEELPLNQHFCLRASINIDKNSLTNTPTLLIGMLASTKLYWDDELLTNNGVVGKNFEDETPGTIITLIRIPDKNLKTGKHLLSGEMSTFHVGKKLKSIGYILKVVDEQKLNNIVLMVSMISALFFGTLFILSIIFQLVYWLYQRNYSYQLFSLFCFFSALLLSTEQAKLWLNYTYDWHVYRLSLIYVLTFVVSFILPIFYIYQYQLSSKKKWFIAIMISLLALGMLKPAYDVTSSLLQGGIAHLKKIIRYNQTF